MIGADEAFVDFALMSDIRKAEKAKVIHLNVSLDNEYEEPHLSELERRLIPFDEVETFVTVKTLVKYHRKTLLKTLEYMEKEGQPHGKTGTDNTNAYR